MSCPRCDVLERPCAEHQLQVLRRVVAQLLALPLDWSAIRGDRRAGVEQLLGDIGDLLEPGQRHGFVPTVSARGRVSRDCALCGAGADDHVSFALEASSAGERP